MTRRGVRRRHAGRMGAGRAHRCHQRTTGAEVTLAMIVVVGLWLAARPLASDAAHRLDARRRAEGQRCAAASLPDATRQRLLVQAEEHNARLARSRQGARELDDEERASYGRLLRLDRDAGGADGDGGTIAVVEIPALGLTEPVVRGTGEQSLARGVGHAPWSSLPVGGPSTHAVLAAHSGMPDRTLFDDVCLLESGDVVWVHVLGRDLAYAVEDSSVVSPDETESLCVRPGEDLLTLVTCVPYGVNTHRLLVRCRRVSGSYTTSRGPGRAGARPVRLRRLLPLGLAGAPVVALLAAGGVIRMRARRRGGARRPRNHLAIPPHARKGART